MGTRLADLTPIALQVQNDGVALPREPGLNFTGAGVTASHDAANDRINVDIPGGGGGGGYATIQEEGAPLAQETVIDFVGAGVTATPGSGKTVVTIPGGGGGIDREQVANPFTDFYLYDEFFYPIPETSLLDHYEKEGFFTAVNQVIGGQVTFRTNNSANAICRINTCGGGLVAIDATKNWRLVVRLRQQTVTVNTALLISFYTDGGQKPSGVFPFAAPQPPNIEFRADGTGNYFAETDNGVTPNSTDTGVTADTAFHVFEIRSDPSVPNIEFLIDNAVVATFTTNLPTGIKAMFIGCQTQTTAFARLDVDSMFLFQER